MAKPSQYCNYPPIKINKLLKEENLKSPPDIVQVKEKSESLASGESESQVAKKTVSHRKIYLEQRVQVEDWREKSHTGKVRRISINVKRISLNWETLNRALPKDRMDFLFYVCL